MIALQEQFEGLREHFNGRDLLDFSDYTGAEIMQLLDAAKTLKAMRQQGTPTPFLQGKSLGMIFDKASTRTRVSFEVGMFELGGQALYLASGQTQLGRGEPLSDTARVLSRYLHAIMIRTFSHESVQSLANIATIPVINGLTDDHHPCQVLADLQTIIEHRGSLEGATMTYVGDGNNMANSLLQICTLVGMNIRIATPPGYEPNAKVVEQVRINAARSGSEVVITHDVREAADQSDVIYTDVWASMGQEEEAAKRQQAFHGYQVDDALMKLAKKEAIFLHCLPAHRGEEVAESVLEGSQSVIFDQAENRLHAQKAVLVAVAGSL